MEKLLQMEDLAVLTQAEADDVQVGWFHALTGVLREKKIVLKKKFGCLKR